MISSDSDVQPEYVHSGVIICNAQESAFFLSLLVISLDYDKIPAQEHCNSSIQKAESKSTSSEIDWVISQNPVNKQSQTNRMTLGY